MKRDSSVLSGSNGQTVLQGGSGKDSLNTPINDKQLGEAIDTLKAENPDLKQSYNQWKSDATARIEAKNAELKPQSQPPLPPRKPETPSDKLFKDYRKNLGQEEGGLADRPIDVDPGGLTQKGMSQRQLNELRKRDEWKNLPESARNLTDRQINDIFRKEYFDNAQIEKLANVEGLNKAAPKLSEQVFDSGVLHGIKNSGQWLQKSLDETLGTDLRVPDINGKLIYDGIVGSDTRKIVEQAESDGKIKDVNNLFAKKRIDFMNSLPNRKPNPGWIPRAKRFMMQ